jgi:hypothetical protein
MAAATASDAKSRTAFERVTIQNLLSSDDSRNAVESVGNFNRPVGPNQAENASRKKLI